MKLTKIHILNEAKNPAPTFDDFLKKLKDKNLKVRVESDGDVKSFTVKVPVADQFDFLTKAYKQLIGKKMDKWFRKTAKNEIETMPGVDVDQALSIKSMETFINSQALGAAQGNKGLIALINNNKEAMKDYMDEYHFRLFDKFDIDHTKLLKFVLVHRSKNASSHKNSFEHEMSHWEEDDEDDDNNEGTNTHRLKVKFDHKELKEISDEFFAYLLDERSNVPGVWKAKRGGDWSLGDPDHVVEVFFKKDPTGKGLIAHHIYDFAKEWKKKHNKPLSKYGKEEIADDLITDIEEHISGVHERSYNGDGWPNAIEEKKNKLMQSDDGKKSRNKLVNAAAKQKHELQRAYKREKLENLAAKHAHHQDQVDQHQTKMDELQQEIDDMDEKMKLTKD